MIRSRHDVNSLLRSKFLFRKQGIRGDYKYINILKFSHLQFLTKWTFQIV